MTSPEALFEQASAMTPEVVLERSAFEAAWQQKSAMGPPIDPARAGDVLLAAAIEAGQPAALRWLQASIQRGLRGLGARVPQQALADVESSVLALVAVGSAEHPARIRAYAARGPLLGWLQVIIARTGRARAQAEASASGSSDVDALEAAVITELESTTAPAEREAFHRRFSGVLGPALRVAGRKLTERERALISLHYVDHVSLEELSRSYQVHRATISRWLEAARQSFLAATRDELSQRTGIGRLEVDSLVFALERREGVSLSLVFANDRLSAAPVA